jgi:hypothetical protein
MKCQHWRSSERKNVINMLKIKEGVELFPFGHSKDAEALTSESKLSQESLEYLKVKYPDDVEEVKESKQLKQK